MWRGRNVDNLFNLVGWRHLSIHSLSFCCICSLFVCSDKYYWPHKLAWGKTSIHINSIRLPSRLLWRRNLWSVVVYISTRNMKLGLYLFGTEARTLGVTMLERFFIERVVTLQLRIMVLVKVGYGENMQMNGHLRQKDGGNKDQWKADSERGNW